MFFNQDFKKKPRAGQIFMALVFFMLANAFWLKIESEVVYVILPIIWIFTERHFKIDTKITIISGLFFLFLCAVFMLINETLASGLAAWAFLLLLSGTATMIFQKRAEF
ncbi:hypothetical protein KKA69_03750 [Patescibacteria group bacterium]|nr:hypothetical protein [Patescibacteria group bacterium]